jgi:iron complex outermembrane receptor protein
VTTLRLLLLALAGAAAAFPQRVGDPTDALDKLSVDELFSIQVTSVGRKAQQLSSAPAAVYVLTAEDIRRSGATSIPEALRWVPGLTVLRQDGRSWAISARGSARIFADKMLVMIDGRSLYTPLFSGVLWDWVDVPLQDIEQIEILRGPGAVMWGPNAVNGVINIITKRAESTKGTSISAATGNELPGSLEARWGAAPGDTLAYRISGKMDYRTPAYGSPGLFYFNRFSYLDPSIDNLDSAAMRLGFRIDGKAGEKNLWTVQGDLFKRDRQDETASPALTPAVKRGHGHTDYDGGFIQAAWTRPTSDGGEGILQFRYDRSGIRFPFIFGEMSNLTLDYQRRVHTGERNELYWGVGYQQYWDDTSSVRQISFSPASSTYRSGDVVLRDEWQIVPDRLLVSVGVRLDYNSYRNLEYQPSLRLLFTPGSRQSAWIAASRAIRIQDRLDRDLLYDNGQVAVFGRPVSILMQGSNDMRSEVERSLEAGYRRQSGQRWSADVAVFLSDYSRLRSLYTTGVPVLRNTTPIPSLALLMNGSNAGSGRSYGGELSGTWQVRDGWRLLPSYSYVRDSHRLPSAGAFSYIWDRVPSDLRHQGLFRSQHDLTRYLQLDLMARARSRDLALQLPGALLFDAHLSWRPTRSGELSFTVENIMNRHILETYPETVFPAIPLRRLYVLKWTQRL